MNANAGSDVAWSKVRFPRFPDRSTVLRHLQPSFRQREIAYRIAAAAGRETWQVRDLILAVEMSPDAVPYQRAVCAAWHEADARRRGEVILLDRDQLGLADAWREACRREEYVREDGRRAIAGQRPPVLSEAIGR
jgi:hypothetical protein